MALHSVKNVVTSIRERDDGFGHGFFVRKARIIVYTAGELFDQRIGSEGPTWLLEAKEQRRESTCGAEAQAVLPGKVQLSSPTDLRLRTAHQHISISLSFVFTSQNKTRTARSLSFRFI